MGKRQCSIAGYRCTPIFKFHIRIKREVLEAHRGNAHLRERTLVQIILQIHIFPFLRIICDLAEILVCNINSLTSKQRNPLLPTSDELITLFFSLILGLAIKIILPDDLDEQDAICITIQLLLLKLVRKRHRYAGAV